MADPDSLFSWADSHRMQSTLPNARLLKGKKIIEMKLLEVDHSNPNKNLYSVTILEKGNREHEYYATAMQLSMGCPKESCKYLVSHLRGWLKKKERRRRSKKIRAENGGATIVSTKRTIQK